MTEKFSDVHPYLFHYTNEQGLYGILKEQCLWATHYKFLNDSSEIILSKEKIRDIVYPCTLEFYNNIDPKNPVLQETISTYGNLEAKAKYDSELFIDACYETLTPEIYIISFCTESEDNYINQNGILSQWRAYGGDGGFAVVLNSEGLQNMLDFEYKFFHYGYLEPATVVYSDEDEKYNLMLNELRPYLTDYLKKLFEQTLLIKNEPPDLGNAFSWLIKCFTHYKHKGFKEENEARIIAMPLNEGFIQDDTYKSKPEKERKFRNKNGGQIPYIELFRSLGERLPLPIEKLIVGPHKDKELRAAALRIMLRNTDIDVTISDIPYIN